jgi:HK97 family phage portal protein
MAVLVSYGDRLLTRQGRPSWLKRPSVPLALFGRDGLPMTADGRVVSYLGLYETQPWIAAAVNKLNRSIMDLPLRLYRETNKEGEVEPVYRHPLLDLIKNPWTGGSPARLKQKMTFPALVHGNAVLGVERDTPDGPPTGFVPLDWRFLVPYTLENGEVFFWESNEPGKRQFWDRDDVIHFAFEAGNGDLGISPLSQLGITMQAEDAAQTHQAETFQNGARPSGALMTEADLTREQRMELKNEVAAQPNGSFWLLTGGMKYEATSHTAVEAELIEQRKLNREEVAAVYDVDPPMIGILDHATYSNIAEMYDRLYQSTCGPWLTMQADTLTAQLIDREPAFSGKRYFFAYDLSAVLRSDTPQEIEAVATMIASGIGTPNEGRTRLRMRSSTQKGSDKLYLPTNNLGEMGKEPETPPQLESPASGVRETEDVVEDPVKANLRRHMEIAAKRMSAGQDPWNRDRFLKELYEDAPNAPAEPLADLVEGLIQRAGGDPEACRRLSASRFS